MTTTGRKEQIVLKPKWQCLRETLSKQRIPRPLGNHLGQERREEEGNKRKEGTHHQNRTQTVVMKRGFPRGL